MNRIGRIGFGGSVLATAAVANRERRGLIGACVTAERRRAFHPEHPVRTLNSAFVDRMNRMGRMRFGGSVKATANVVLGMLDGHIAVSLTYDTEQPPHPDNPVHPVQTTTTAGGRAEWNVRS